MIVLDGNAGEGNGQALRSALTLAILTRTAFRMERIRAGKQQPGLLAPQLAVIEAARVVSNAEVTGAELGSRALTFKPRSVHGGDLTLDAGPGGSACLVFQMVLPALLRAGRSSQVTIRGGTHEPGAPTFEFLSWSYLPILTRMGAKVELTLEAPGFHPRGGGELRARIEPSELDRLELEERGASLERHFVTKTAGIPPAAADRQLRVAKDRLSLAKTELTRVDHPEALGPANITLVLHRFEHVTAVFSGVGERSSRPEEVAEQAIGPSLRYLECRGALDEHLADQLLVPMAMGRGGVFTTSEPSAHFDVQVELLRTFLGGEIEADTTDDKTWTITMRGALL